MNEAKMRATPKTSSPSLMLGPREVETVSCTVFTFLGAMLDR